MIGSTACPFCSKAIRIFLPVWARHEDEFDPDYVVIHPERSETDKKYMAQMGLKDPETE